MIEKQKNSSPTKNTIKRAATTITKKKHVTFNKNPLPSERVKRRITTQAGDAAH